jgi:hypothetical protein
VRILTFEDSLCRAVDLCLRLDNRGLNGTSHYIFGSIVVGDVTHDLAIRMLLSE